LGLFFQSIGEELHAALHFQLSSALRELPSQTFPIEAWLQAHGSLGNALLIGDFKEFPYNQIFEIIETCNCQKWSYLSRSQLTEQLGYFDSILFLPPHGRLTHRKIPPFVREIQNCFPFLDEMVYSQSDIDAFFSAIDKDTDPKELFHFFIELERKKNITQEQFQQISQRLGLEVEPLSTEEDCLFFETLEICLERHMKKGSVFHAFLRGVDIFDDSRIFDQVIVNPSLGYREREAPDGLWITVQKF
jgi:hypothetical protein